MKLSPTEIYNSRNVFIIGATGFVGKVALSMLLDRFPGVGRVYVTVRARSKEESETRFWNNVITAPPFDPVRERYGAAFEDFIRDKVRVVGGDIGEDNLGFTEEEAQALAADIDVLINSAGNVTFNPTLESALHSGAGRTYTPTPRASASNSSRRSRASAAQSSALQSSSRRFAIPSPVGTRASRRPRRSSSSR